MFENRSLLTSATYLAFTVVGWFCGSWFRQGPGKAVVPDSVTSGPELVDWLHRELQQRKVEYCFVLLLIFGFRFVSRVIRPLQGRFNLRDELNFWR